MKPVKVIMSGATGLVGSRIFELLSPHPEFEFIPLTSAQCDITQLAQVEQFLKTHQYDIFLHLAAYTNVDKAETEPHIAQQLNVDATKNIFQQVVSQNKKMIYISTDFVFDGTHPPYLENSSVNPISQYGKSKAAGEAVVKDHAMIVRIAYPYRASFELKKDFVRTIKYLLEQGTVINAVTDSLIVPTFVDDCAYALQHLMLNYSPDTYHIVGSQALSPFDAVQTIAKVFKLDQKLIIPTTYEVFFKGKARRPQWSDIRSSKNTFYPMKSFQQGLEAFNL